VVVHILYSQLKLGQSDIGDMRVDASADSGINSIVQYLGLPEINIFMQPLSHTEKLNKDILHL
jgi:hypothetical protein